MPQKEKGPTLVGPGTGIDFGVWIPGSLAKGSRPGMTTRGFHHPKKKKDQLSLAQ
jgi:hypothetical protein